MSFEHWINTVENQKSILEQAQEELVYHRYIDNHSFWQKVLSWLKASYNIGSKDSNNIVQSLKNEIKTQRKEIAALREERRLLLDQDKIPEIGWQE
jgi:hypothetical protein